MINFPYSDKKIGLAVSGGKDSAVMMHLAAQKGTPNKFIIFTVNHGLRPESASETLSVQKTAHQYGFECVILELNDLSQKSTIQKNAREARYRALSQAANKHNCDIICIAHHQNDICETLLSRLSHKSGHMGLAVMPPFFYHMGTIFHRPMLHLAQKDITDYTDETNLEILEDPSNHNIKYERVRHREYLKQYPDIIPNLLLLHHKASILKYDILYERDQFIKNHVKLSAFGLCEIDHPALNALNTEVALSVLKYCIMFVTGKNYIQIHERPVKNMTIGGAYIHINKKIVSVFREKRNLQYLHCTAESVTYDNRFDLTLPEAGELSHDLQKDYDAPHFTKETLPILKAESGRVYRFDELNPIYRPQSLDRFNSDPILHHLAISQLKWSSSK